MENTLRVSPLKKDVWKDIIHLFIWTNSWRFWMHPGFWSLSSDVTTLAIRFQLDVLSCFQQPCYSHGITDLQHCGRWGFLNKCPGKFRNYMIISVNSDCTFNKVQQYCKNIPKEIINSRNLSKYKNWLFF